MTPNKIIAAIQPVKDPTIKPKKRNEYLKIGLSERNVFIKYI
jgi:hypothetical protein